MRITLWILGLVAAMSATAAQTQRAAEPADVQRAELPKKSSFAASDSRSSGPTCSWRASARTTSSTRSTAATISISNASLRRAGRSRMPLDFYDASFKYDEERKRRDD